MAEALDGARDHRLDLGEVTDVGEDRLDSHADLRDAGNGCFERGCADIAQDEVGVGLGRKLLRHRGAERATRAGDRDDSSCHASKYPPSTLSTVPVTNADASDARN